MSIPKSAILLKILLVSEYQEDENNIRGTLIDAGFDLVLVRVDSEEDIHNVMDRDQWNLVIIDNLLTKFTSAKVVRLLEKRLQETPHLILFGGVEDISAIEILEASGSHNYVTKVKMATLGQAIVNEMKNAGDRMKRRLDLEQSIVMLLDAWSRALDMRDKGTEGHTQRVTALTMKLARALKVPKADLINIHRGALLHDIGKIGIPDKILLKEGGLTDEEWAIMRSHPTLAYNLLFPIFMLRDALEIPYCHHEKWDGNGYPRGIRFDAIPLSARIFSICDNFDALMSERPYRAAWTQEKALEYIQDESGKYFDPDIVPVFLTLMKEGK